MAIRFIKAEGAGNDFLLSREEDAPTADRSAIARAICDRNRGIGADGWYLVRLAPAAAAHDTAIHDAAIHDAAIHLYNSDGSEAELSGNGTRCVAAWLASQWPGKTEFRILTGAGLRTLTLRHVEARSYTFSMTMGQPIVFPEEELAIPGPAPIRVRGRRIDVGNPQFSVRVDGLDFPWKERGAQLESHPAFPFRSNISFYRVLDRHRVEARFFERGAGATLSSGTGSTGVAAAALSQDLVDLPVTVITEAGPLEFRDEGNGLVLDGSARLIGEGDFYWGEPE